MIFTTPLRKSPEVRVVEEAVITLLTVAVEEAFKRLNEGSTVKKLPEAVLTVKMELTLNVLSMVEEAKTKIPAVVEVGVRVGCPEKAICQAPGEPAAVQVAPVTESRPEEEAWTHWVEAEARLSKVIAPVAVKAPFNLVAPATPRVVVGRFVPIPTRFSEALTIRVLLSMFKPPLKVEVAVAESTIWNRVVGAAWSEMKFRRLPV